MASDNTLLLRVLFLFFHGLSDHALPPRSQGLHARSKHIGTMPEPGHGPGNPTKVCEEGSGSSAEKLCEELSPFASMDLHSRAVDSEGALTDPCHDTQHPRSETAGPI